jgi:nucleotide-binding universal stress UspA family protein
MYEDILFPYDGSDGSAEALHHAAEIAHWADATVHLLYVADTNRDSVTVVDGRPVDALVRRGGDVVDEAGETLRTLGVAHDSEVVQGNPAPTIAEYAERHDHDLVVVPTHGREGVSRYLLGSVTEKVVRLSPVPVLTVRMRRDEQLVFPYEDVLLPADGSAAATDAARHGLSLASALDATVHVLSVVDDTALGLGVGPGERTGRDRGGRGRRLGRGGAGARTGRQTRRARDARRGDPRLRLLERRRRGRDGDDGTARDGPDTVRERRGEDGPLRARPGRHRRGVDVAGVDPVGRRGYCACRPG